MTEEFNLGDKEIYADEFRTRGKTYEEGMVYPKQDVKEFIRRLKETYEESIKLALSFNKTEIASNIRNRIMEIDKLAGDKLK